MITPRLIWNCSSSVLTGVFSNGTSFKITFIVVDWCLRTIL